MKDALTNMGPAIVTFNRPVYMPDGKAYEAVFCLDWKSSVPRWWVSEEIIIAAVPCDEDPVKMDVYSFEAPESE